MRDFKILQLCEPASHLWATARQNYAYSPDRLNEIFFVNIDPPEGGHMDKPGAA